MRVFDFGALAKKGVRLVEEENRGAGLSLEEDTVQTLFGLSDVFADYL